MSWGGVCDILKICPNFVGIKMYLFSNVNVNVYYYKCIPHFEKITQNHLFISMQWMLSKQQSTFSLYINKIIYK